MNKKTVSNKKYKKSNIIFSLLIFFYLIVHLIDFIYIYYIYLLVYEFIINVIFVWWKYIFIFVRASFPYIVAYIVIYICCLIFFKNKLIVYGYGKQNENKKTAYIFYIIKEKSNYIILLVHTIFFGIVFYFELYYNSMVLLIIFLGFIFIWLSVYIKNLLKEKDLIGSKKLNLLVNCILIVVTGIIIGLLGEMISDNIYFKNNLSEYFYKVIQHKNRLLLKYQRDIYGYWSRYAVGLKRQLITERYSYLKNIILNKNVLADVSYKKLKYLLYKKKLMHKNMYNKVIKNNSLNNYGIKKDNLLLFNNFENNVSAQVNKQAVWNEIAGENNKRLFNALKYVQFKKEFLNIKLHLYNVYKTHWTNYFSTEGKVSKVKYLFKKTLKKDYYHKHTSKYKYNKYQYKYMYEKNKKCNKNFKLIKKGFLNKVNTKIKLRYLYKMDLDSILKKKEKLYDLLSKEKKNNIKKYIKPVIEQHKYDKLGNIIRQVQKLKGKILKLDFNTVSFLTYKYNNFIIWWDKKFNIVQLLSHSKSNYIKAKTLIIKIPKKAQNYYNYMRLKKKIPIHVLRIKSSKAYFYDKKRLLLEWYKPYKKYPKYIFNHKATYYEKQHEIVGNCKTKHNLILGFRCFDKWYEHKRFQNILWFLDWLGYYKRQHSYVIKPKDLNIIHFFEDNKIYTVKGNQGHWSTILDNTKQEKTDTVQGYWDKKGNWVYKRDVIKPKPVTALDRYLIYFKRSVIYEYLLLKHNNSIWSKYIKWMGAKYTKVMKWGSRLYKYFYKANNNKYSKYIEEYELNNNKNYNREIEENLLQFLKQGKNGYDYASICGDLLSWLQLNNLNNIVSTYNFYGFLEEFKDYVISKIKYDSNMKNNLLLNNKLFLDKYIFWEEYMRIIEYNIRLEEIRQFNIESNLHNKRVVEIILDYAHWLDNPFAEFSDILEEQKSNMRYKFAEKYFNEIDEELTAALDSIEDDEMGMLEAAVDNQIELKDYSNEVANKMKEDALDLNRYRKLMLKREDVTLDNITEVLLTPELYRQDPTMYYTLVLALDFDDEYVEQIKGFVAVQESIFGWMLQLDKLKEFHVAYLHTLESLLFALDGLDMLIDEKEPEIENDLDLHFYFLLDIQDSVNEPSNKLLDTNKIYWEKKPKYTEQEELYNNLEQYLINKDWENYNNKRYKEELFSFKNFKKK